MSREPALSQASTIFRAHSTLMAMGFSTMMTLMPASAALDDGLVVVEVVGRHAHHVEPGLLVHLDRRVVAVLGRDLPLIAELVEPLLVDVGDGD